jgi:ribosomal protein S18 acetylase RimI-like enzyme
MKAKFRVADAADVPFLTSVLEMASRGHLPRGPWDLCFPDAAERERALALLAGGEIRSWGHRSIFEIATVDGAAAAAMGSFASAELGDALGKALFDVFQRLAWSPERIAAIGPLLAAHVRCFPAMEPGLWIVENVGTRADQRRRGLVGALLERALERGRERGFAHAQISCLIGNDAAQRAYEKVGFAVVEELRDAEFERAMGAPGYSRMTRALGG